ncbi:hypothetical protein DH2020_025061 [Rehmannia glutinosa]|uniref:DUF7815 domain-containing protein n=1 Tax=Rehmannia glutinosa TaxID=99300 RepID=A0ABR0W0U0_REHGL
MSQVPRELIRQVQICTRAAAGLSDYNPSEHDLPALPSLSAAIAASDPSPPHLRCKNCKGMLLRGSESIICVYCGLGPHHDVVQIPSALLPPLGISGCSALSVSMDRDEVVGIVAIMF